MKPTRIQPLRAMEKTPAGHFKPCLTRGCSMYFCLAILWLYLVYQVLRGSIFLDQYKFAALKNFGKDVQHKIYNMQEENASLQAYGNLSKEREQMKLKTTVKELVRSRLTTGPRKNSKDKIYIGYECIGGLGNQLFGYTAAIGIAERNNREAVFAPNVKLLSEVFPLIQPKIMKVNQTWKTMLENHIHKINPKFSNLPKVNVSLATYLQCFSYFKDIFKELYSTVFSQVDFFLQQKAKNLIANFNMQYKNRHNLSTDVNPTKVCLHIRRGDFLEIKNIEAGFLVPSLKDILNAIKNMKKKHKNSLFIVASNGIEWVKDNLKIEDLYFSNFQSANQDFVLMSHCDHMIMTVGTFGWWAGWFTYWRGGTVLYYQHQFNQNSYLAKGCNRHDYLPADWLAYNNRSVTRSGNLGNSCS